MKVINKKVWNEYVENNTDFYGKGIIEYAECWANLMETKIESGEKLEDIAYDTSLEADTEGITGFMYGAAVVVLYKVWEHGEQLRKWHNLQTQIGTEGEKANEEGAILNPAILEISLGE